MRRRGAGAVVIVSSISGWKPARDPEGFAAFLQEMPNGAPLDGADVADVVAYLLSDQSRAVNGANIPVDGAQNAPSIGGY
jgi:3-oxoacyl-[acyl-carrier protein] reductase